MGDLGYAAAAPGGGAADGPLARLGLRSNVAGFRMATTASSLGVRATRAPPSSDAHRSWVYAALQAEFTPLAEWVREKTLFDLISSIGFFRNYLTGRCFRRWLKVRKGLGRTAQSTAEPGDWCAVGVSYTACSNGRCSSGRH